MTDVSDCDSDIFELPDEDIDPPPQLSPPPVNIIHKQGILNLSRDISDCIVFPSAKDRHHIRQLTSRAIDAKQLSLGFSHHSIADTINPYLSAINILRQIFKQTPMSQIQMEQRIEFHETWQEIILICEKLVNYKNIAKNEEEKSNSISIPEYVINLFDQCCHNFTGIVIIDFQLLNEFYYDFKHIFITYSSTKDDDFKEMEEEESNISVIIRFELLFSLFQHSNVSTLKILNMDLDSNMISALHGHRIIEIDVHDMKEDNGVLLPMTSSDELLLVKQHHVKSSTIVSISSNSTVNTMLDFKHILHCIKNHSSADNSLLNQIIIESKLQCRESLDKYSQSFTELGWNIIYDEMNSAIIISLKFDQAWKTAFDTSSEGDDEQEWSVRSWSDVPDIIEPCIILPSNSSSNTLQTISKLNRRHHSQMDLKSMLYGISMNEMKVQSSPPPNRSKSETLVKKNITPPINTEFEEKFIRKYQVVANVSEDIDNPSTNGHAIQRISLVQSECPSTSNEELSYSSSEEESDDDESIEEKLEPVPELVVTNIQLPVNANSESSKNRSRGRSRDRCRNRATSNSRSRGRSRGKSNSRSRGRSRGKSKKPRKSLLIRMQNTFKDELIIQWLTHVMLMDVIFSLPTMLTEIISKMYKIHVYIGGYLMRENEMYSYDNTTNVKIKNSYEPKYFVIQKGTFDVIQNGQYLGWKLYPGSSFGSDHMLYETVRNVAIQNTTVCTSPLPPSLPLQQISQTAEIDDRRSERSMSTISVSKNVGIGIVWVLNLSDYRSIYDKYFLNKFGTGFQNLTDAKVNQFWTLSVLGTGSFGRVSLVKCSIIDKKEDEDERKVNCDEHKIYSMKKISKNSIIQNQQTHHIQNERSIMALMSYLNCNFICKLFAKYQDQNYVYFLMEALIGGELYTVLQWNKKFSEKIAKFYIACVLLAFEALHSMNIIYRDIKPENIMIHRNGYVKLVDFGLSKRRNAGNTFCGTLEYLSPEMLSNDYQGFEIDFWGLGILLYEIVCGKPPFKDYEQILTQTVEFSEELIADEQFSEELINIVEQLLVKNQYQRLGTYNVMNGKNGIIDVFNHEWFASIESDSEIFNWDDMRLQKIVPPYIPDIINDEDTSNFDPCESETEEEKKSHMIVFEDESKYDWCKYF